MLRIDHLVAAELSDLTLLRDALLAYSYERPSDRPQIDRLTAVLEQAITHQRTTPEPPPLMRVFF